MDTLLGIAWLILMGLFVKGYWNLIRDEQKEWEKKNKR
jgi:high-affinity Fe2+/Pb2+ permease